MKLSKHKRPCEMLEIS